MITFRIDFRQMFIILFNYDDDDDDYRFDVNNNNY